MKLGQATICYQHQEAQNLLENLLMLKAHSILECHRKDIKEAIDWIIEANESAVRMENKLKYYKNLIKKYESD